MDVYRLVATALTADMLLAKLGIKSEEHLQIYYNGQRD
jgi:hypothetical protein